MPRRRRLLLLLPCAFAMAAATAQPRQPRPAQSEALRDDSGVIREQPLSSGRVTGRVEVPVRPGETPVTIRSIAPTGGGQYRIVFTALDLDGDGFISRSEAAANPSLADEFDALDVRRRGQLDRADLAGWLVD
ncbi:EF-hand domain-containing protein [Xanthomonas sp. 60]